MNSNNQNEVISRFENDTNLMDDVSEAVDTSIRGSNNLTMLPVFSNEDPVLGEELAVDLDKLMEDQRQRIMAGELSMDQLKAELDSNQQNEDNVENAKENESMIDPTEEKINYGEPDITTGSLVISANIEDTFDLTDKMQKGDL